MERVRFPKMPKLKVKMPQVPKIKPVKLSKFYKGLTSGKKNVIKYPKI